MKASRRLLALVVVALFLGCSRDPVPSTVTAYCRNLEAGGWVFKEDKCLNGVNFITYERRAGDLLLSACPVFIKGRLELCQLWVRGPARPGTNKMVGRAICEAMAARLRPSISKTLKRAWASVVKHDNSRGIARLQGTVTAPDGWRVTVIEYLAVLPGKPDNALMMISWNRTD